MESFAAIVNDPRPGIVGPGTLGPRTLELWDPDSWDSETWTMLLRTRDMGHCDMAP